MCSRCGVAAGFAALYPPYLYPYPTQFIWMIYSLRYPAEIGS
jgi:hypothetical protein